MTRKPEAALPVLPSSTKPAPIHPQCSASDTCRKPGLTSPFLEGISGYDQKDRLCVHHLIIAIERNRHANKN